MELTRLIVWRIMTYVHVCCQVSFPNTSRVCMQAVLEYLYTNQLSPMADLDPMELIALANRLCLPRLIALTGELSATSSKWHTKQRTHSSGTGQSCSATSDLKQTGLLALSFCVAKQQAMSRCQIKENVSVELCVAHTTICPADVI